MIKLTILAGLLAANTAFAGVSATDSWDTIRSYSKLSAITQGAYSTAFGTHGFFNACADGDVLRSVEPLVSCAETKWKYQYDGGYEQVCMRWESEDVELPLEQVENRCKQWKNSGGYEGGQLECVAYEQVRVSIPLAHKFGVYAWGDSGYENGYSRQSKFLFNKEFEIPFCSAKRSR